MGKLVADKITAPISKFIVTNPQLTKQEYFALQIAAALISSSQSYSQEQIVSSSVAIADSLLKTLIDILRDLKVRGFHRVASTVSCLFGSYLEQPRDLLPDRSPPQAICFKCNKCPRSHCYEVSSF